MTHSRTKMAMLSAILPIVLAFAFAAPLDSAHALNPSFLTVIKNVVNDDSGTAVPSDFTMIVNGTNVSSPTFPGSSSGTLVQLDAGIYNVTEIQLSGYTVFFTSDCNGVIGESQNKTCTITNDDVPSQTETLSAEKDSFLRDTLRLPA